MILLSDLKKQYLSLGTSYEKRIFLAKDILEYISFNNINLFYSETFYKELNSFLSYYFSHKDKDVNLLNLLINNSDKNEIKVDSVFFIKKKILSKFNEKDLNFLRINHSSLTNFLKDNKELTEAYIESKFINPKELKEKFGDNHSTINYLILKKEYDLYKKIEEFYEILNTKYKTLIIKDVAYNKPVYIGLKHLNQKKIYMEGPYLVSKCPKCGNKMMHLLEGIDGTIYVCSNHDCKFFISGNYFLKTGSKDLINFFNIKEEINKKRNSSHYKVYKTLNDIQYKKKYVEIESDGFRFLYQYSFDKQNSLTMKLFEIHYGFDFIDLKPFYHFENTISNFINNFFEEIKKN